MSFSLEDDEYALVEHLPAEELIALAAELDMIPPEDIDRRALVESCLHRMLARLREERVPLSPYDQEDVQSLPPDLLAALAHLQGTPAEVRAIMRAGKRAYRIRERRRASRQDPVAYMLPILLKPLLRLASQEHDGPKG